MKLYADSSREFVRATTQNRIVDRLRLIDTERAQNRMAALKVGQLASFATDKGDRMLAVVVKHNRLTVTVACQHGPRWTMPPQALRPETEASRGAPGFAPC